MVDMSVDIAGLRLANPVMPASGTIAEGMADTMDLGRLGAIVTKTITEGLREGNPPPRVAELPNATLFSIGIPSKGAEHFLREIVPFYRRYECPLVASISADTVEDFARLAAKISVPGVSAIEINISCPNLKKDGRAFGMDPDDTAKVVAAIKSATGVSIWPKLTPNVGDIADIARAAEAAGADALVCANAMLAMGIDIRSRLPRLGLVMGGMTGPATRPVILRMAYQTAQAVSIPVIGCGGIATAEDALEYMLAGCAAVQVGTSSFVSTSTMARVIAGIEAYCVEQGVAAVGDLVGGMRMHGPARVEAGAL